LKHPQWQRFSSELRRGSGAFLLSVLLVAVAFASAALVLGYGRITASLAAALRSEVGLTLFVAYGADENAALEKVKKRLQNEQGIARVALVGSTEGFNRLKKVLPETSRLAGYLDYNPLPPTIEIEVDRNVIGESKIVELRDQLGAFKEISFAAGAGKEAIFAGELTAAARRALNIAFGLLAFCAACIIAGAISLSFLHRREEINVLRMLGAGRYFIWTPFLWQAIVVGLFGAAAGLFAADYGLKRFYESLLPYVKPLVGEIALQPLLAADAYAILGVGAGLGFLGALAALLWIDK
jgi:cell division transport system permease protein